MKQLVVQRNLNSSCQVATSFAQWLCIQLFQIMYAFYIYLLSQFLFKKKLVFAVYILNNVSITIILYLQENVKISSPIQNKKIKNQSGEPSTIGTRPPIVGDDVLQHLGNNCKQLVSLLTLLPFGKDYIDMEIDQTIFHHTNVGYIYVMMEDIQDLLTMNWLDVSIIQVFIL